MKKTSHRATSLVQLLARIVLFLAFVPTGWHHAMHLGKFTGDAGARLRELGIVSVDRFGVDDSVNDSSVRLASNGARVGERESTAHAHPDSLVFVRVARQETPAAALSPALPDDATAGTDLNTRSLHELTLVFDRHNLPRPEIWAWTVTAFELFGGTLILLGLFTRLWAAGLTAWAVGLLVLNTTSATEAWDSIWQTTDVNLAAVRTLALMQLSLIVLAASLLLTGAGAMSLDRVIFGGGGKGSDKE